MKINFEYIGYSQGVILSQNIKTITNQMNELLATYDKFIKDTSLMEIDNKDLNYIDSMIDDCIETVPIIIDTLSNTVIALVESDFKTMIDETEFQNMHSSIKKSINEIKHRKDMINFIYDAYSKGVKYEEFANGNKRRYFVNPEHSRYIDVYFTPNAFVFTDIYSEDKILKNIHIKLDIKDIKKKMKEKNKLKNYAMFELPHALKYTSDKIFSSLRKEGVCFSSPFEFALRMFIMSWFFNTLVEYDNKYYKSLVKTYSDIFINNIKERDIIHFKMNNIFLIRLVNISKYSKLYNDIHKRIKDKI